MYYNGVLGRKMTSDDLKSKIDSSNTVTIKGTVIEGNVEIIHDSDTISIISFDNCLFHDDVVIEINNKCYISFTNCRSAGNIYIRHSSINNMDFYHVECKDFTIYDSMIMNSRFKYIDCIGSIRLNNTTIYESFMVTVQSYSSIDINSSHFFRDTIHNIGVVTSCLNVLLNTAFNCCSIMGVSILRAYVYNCEFKYISISECSDVAITTYNSNIRDMIPQLCPEEGSFIGYKDVEIAVEHGYGSAIAVLEIPADADRLTGINKKCRCSKAKVVIIETLDGEILSDTIGTSPTSNTKIKYIPGEMVYADSFDDNILVECSHGIHFFMSKKEAIDY